jgi:hypothetical protein
MLNRPAGFELALGLALVAAGMSPPGGAARAAAQTASPCTLVTVDEIQPLAPNTDIAEGVAGSPTAGFSTCRYMWGEGVGRVRLNVSVSEASQMFSGMSPDLVRKELQATVTPDTTDAVIPDVGEAAVFNADSPVYVRGSAYVKGRILQVYLDGLDARDKKDQVIALLMTAASRL